jgi:WD40 repeat protein
MKKLLFGSMLAGIAFLSIGIAQETIPKLEQPVWSTPTLGGVVFSSRFNGNDSLALTAGADGAIQIWNTSTGKVTRTIEASSLSIYLAAFSKDGSKIVSSGVDDTTRVWNAKTGALIQDIESGAGSANFSPDGNFIVASALDDEDVILVNSKDGKVIRTLKGHTDYVYESDFSVDGQRIVTSSDDLTAKVWETKTGKLLRSFKHPKAVLDATFIAGNSRIVTGDDDGFVRVWDVTSGKELLKQKAHDGVVALAVSQDQSKFLTGGYDSKIRMWDAKTAKQLRVFEGHERAIYSLAFGQKDQKILSASGDGTAKIWDVKTAKVLSSLEGHRFVTRSVTFSADNKKILTSTDLRDVRIYAVETGQEVSRFRIGEALNTAAFSPDGTTFVTASDTHGDIWKTEDGTLVESLEGHDGAMRSAVYSSDGQKILSVGSDQTVRIWNALSAKEIFSLKHENDVSVASFSFDLQQIVSVDIEGKTFIWDATNGQLIREFAVTPDDYFSFLLTPLINNNLIITSNRSDSYVVWDLNNRRLIEDRTDKISTDGLVRAVSADGSMVFIYLGAVGYVQEVATGRIILQIPNLISPSKAVFSSNSQQLIFTSLNGVRLYQLPAELIAQVKKLEVPAVDGTIGSKNIVTSTSIETRVSAILALSTKGALTGLQFLGLKRLIEDKNEPKELTDFLEQRLPEKDFLELVYAGFFERFNVPRGKP